MADVITQFVATLGGKRASRALGGERRVSITSFFSERDPHTPRDLRRVQLEVLILHGAEDARESRSDSESGEQVVVKPWPKSSGFPR